MVSIMVIMFLLSMFLWTLYMLFNGQAMGGVIIISRSSGSAMVVSVVV